MRILRIKGEAIASLYDKFCVDLEHGPIAESGLFAVTGRTGTGKSTILDVMCLALYHKAARYQGVNDKKILEQTDMYQNIMSRGANSCYCEIEYFGQNGMRYLAKWGLRRIKTRNGDVKFSQENCALEIWHDNTGWSRVNSGTSVSALLKQKAESIGLDFSQFTRVVLLPQGQFTSFLTASPKDRVSILNGIADTEIYRRISQQVYGDYKELKDKRDYLVNLRDNATVLDPKELEDLTTNNKEFTAQISALKETLTKVETYEKEFSNYLTLVANLKDLQESLKSKEASAAEDLQKLSFFERETESRDLYFKLQDQKNTKENNLKNIANLEQEVEHLKAEVNEAQHKLSSVKNDLTSLEQEKRDLEPIIHKAQALDGANLEKEKAYNQATVNYQQQCKEVEQVQNEYQTKFRESVIITNQIEEVRAKYLKVKDFEVLNSELSYLKNAPKNYQSALNDCFALSKQSVNLFEGLAQNNKELINAQNNLVSINTKQNSLKKEASSVEFLTESYGKAQELLNTLTKNAQVLEGIERDVQKLAETSQKVHNFISEITSLRQDYKVLTAQQSQLLLEQQHLNSELALAHENYELKRAVMSLEDYRAELKEHECCPLCGSRHHPYIEDIKSIPTSNEVILAKERVELLNNQLLENRQLEVKNKTDLKNITIQGQRKNDELGGELTTFVSSMLALSKTLTVEKANFELDAKFFNVVSALPLGFTEAALHQYLNNDETGKLSIFSYLVLEENDLVQAINLVQGLKEDNNIQVADTKAKVQDVKVALSNAIKAGESLKNLDEREATYNRQISEYKNQIAVQTSELKHALQEALRNLSLSLTEVTNAERLLGPLMPAMQDICPQIKACGQQISVKISNFIAIVTMQEPGVENINYIEEAFKLKNDFADDKSYLQKASQELVNNIALAQKNVETALSLKQQELKLQDSLHQAQTDLAKVTEVVNGANEVLNTAKVTLDNCKETLFQGLKARSLLLEGRSVHEVTQELSNKQSNLQLIEAQVSESVASKQGFLDQKSGALNVTKQETSNLDIALEKTNAQWQQVLSNLNINVDTVISIFNLSKSQLDAISQTRESIRAMREEVKVKEGVVNSTKARLCSQAATISATCFVETLPQNFSESNKEPQKLKAGIVMNMQHELDSLNTKANELHERLIINENNKKNRDIYEQQLQNLKPEFELKQRLSDLIGSADGNKFCNIAQSITLFALTERANNYLRELRPRYSLSVMDDGHDGLELTVIDHHCADCERSVLSLSGGEKFLVSLSLAIGLSDMTCSGTIVQSLFIDEGFDCVDTDSLGVVLEALGQLQSGDKTLGIISHVDMLARSVHVRLKVSAVSDGRSRIELE